MSASSSFPRLPISRSNLEPKEGPSMAAATTDGSVVPASDELDPAASRLYQSADRAYTAAENAYSAGIDVAPTKVKQLAGTVKDAANKAADSSRSFLSKMSNQIDKYADKAHQKASEYRNRSQPSDQISDDAPDQSPSQTYDDTITNREALIPSETESVGFPMSILTWCGTLCGKSSPGDGTRELPTSFLKSQADRLSSALDDASTKLEEATESVKRRAGESSYGTSANGDSDASSPLPSSAPPS